MFNIIPHPAAVHLPIAIAVLFPILFAACHWGVRSRAFDPKISWLVLGATALQLVFNAAAYLTGLHDISMSSAPPAELELHKSAAIWFSGLWLILFIFLLRLHVCKTSWSSFKLVFLIYALCLIQLALGIWLGHLGGGLTFG